MLSKRRSRAMIGSKPSSMFVPAVLVFMALATVFVQPVSSVAFDFSDFDGIEQTFAMATYDDDDFFLNRGGSSPSRQECATITDLICRNEDFSILCTALKQTGLDITLDSKSRVWTLFTPTDEAFETLDNQIAQEAFSSPENVEFILLYHAIKGQEVFSGQLECTERIMMANEKETRTVCSGDQVFQKGGGNVQNKLPEIVDADVKACNGVIHVVNRVILPTKIPGSHYASPTRRPVYYPPTPPDPYQKPTYQKPTRKPTRKPTPYPYPIPTKKPTRKPSPYPTPYPTPRPTNRPPTKYPTPYPVAYPEPKPYYPEPEPYYPEDDHHDQGYYPFINYQEPYHPQEPYYPEPQYPDNDHHDPYYQPEHPKDPYYPDQHHDGHDDDRDNRGGDFPCLSVGDLICQTGGLDLLCEAYHITGLFDFLQIGFDWTIFAPTNEAIEKLIASVPQGTLNAENMADLLLFQMIETSVVEFDDLRCEEWVQMSDGGFSYTHCRGLDKYQVGRGNGFKDSIIMLRDSPIVLREDIGGCNGIVHTVDTVLLPSWWLA